MMTRRGITWFCVAAVAGGSATLADGPTTRPTAAAEAPTTQPVDRSVKLRDGEVLPPIPRKPAIARRPDDLTRVQTLIAKPEAPRLLVQRWHRYSPDERQQYAHIYRRLLEKPELVDHAQEWVSKTPEQRQALRERAARVWQFVATLSASERASLNAMTPKARAQRIYQIMSRRQLSEPTQPDKPAGGSPSPSP